MKRQMINSIVELIEASIDDKVVGIHGRPPVLTFFGFLHGFAYARKPDHPEDYAFLADFDMWIHERFRITLTHSWAKIIHFFARSDKEEIEMLTELFREYMAQRSDDVGSEPNVE